jgi:hypothetical protein
MPVRVTFLTLLGRTAGHSPPCSPSEEGSTFRFAARNTRARSLMASSSPEDAAISYPDQYRRDRPAGRRPNRADRQRPGAQDWRKVVGRRSDGYTVHDQQMSLMPDRTCARGDRGGRPRPGSAVVSGRRSRSVTGAIARSVEDLLTSRSRPAVVARAGGAGRPAHAGPRTSRPRSPASCCAGGGAREYLTAKSLVLAYAVGLELPDPRPVQPRFSTFVVAADNGRILRTPRLLTFFDASACQGVGRRRRAAHAD